MVDVALQSAFTDLCTQAPTGDTSPLFATVATFLYFDAKTNQIILHAEQNFYDEVFSALSNVNSVKICFYDRLYDLYVGVPY